MVLLLYFALKPLYLWDSGMLQISDLLLVFFIAVFIFRTKGCFNFKQEESAKLFRYISLLVTYQFSINFIWYVFIQDFSLLKSSVYYIFNAITFTFTVLITQDLGIDIVKKMIAKGAVLSIIITLAGMLIYTGTSRATGFFNNPNQLGYYSIIVLTVLLYLKNYLSKVEQIVVFLGSIVATFASLSKAAIISVFILISVYSLIYSEKKTFKNMVFKIAAITLIGLALYWLFYSDSDIINNNRTLYLTRYRILHMAEENDSNLTDGRGYGRVRELGTHILWGMGEGAYSRFTVKHNSEVHSTFISLLVSYGIIGFLSYIFFFVKCIKKPGRTIRNIALLSGVFCYSISHNGIRNTLLWILLALMFIDNEMDAVESS